MDSTDRATDFLHGSTDAVAAVRREIQKEIGGFGVARSGWDAELVQEALGRVYLGIRSGRFRGQASIETYARSVARYTCLEHIRKQRSAARLRRALGTRSHQVSAQERSLIIEEENRRNLRVLGALPPESRELLYLVFVEGLGYRATARKLGVSENALRIRVHRLRKKMLDLARAGTEADESVHGTARPTRGL